MARRRVNKGKLSLSSSRKKRIVNIGLLKWRQERRMRTQSSETQATAKTEKLNHTSTQDLSSEAFKPCCSSTPMPVVKKSRKCLHFDDSKSENKKIMSDNSYEEGVVLLESSCEKESSVTELVGRRVVDISHIFDEIKNVNNHNTAMGCTIGNMNVIKEQRFGLNSVLTLKCNMCNLQCTINTDKKHRDSMDINTASVAGAMAVGIGHSQLEELFSAMEVPAMSINTYAKYHHKVSDGWETTALQEMDLAAKEEMQHAIDEGRFTSDGIPVLTVVADGSWSKRSYRTNYNALSGVAAIVGAYTKKVLFLGVRNKYCTICARAEEKSTPVPEHACYKNWTSSSASMEADIVVEGFQRSIDMYNVVYGTILADGDSNVYSQILESRPYPNWTVDKIECTNHLLRNYCSKLREISSNTSSGPVEMRKLVNSNILRLRTAVTKAAQYRQQQSDVIGSNKISQLQQDITNSASHVFGEHLRCKALAYFCDGPKEKEKNHVLELKKCGIYQKIMRHISYLTDNARSLLLHANNNPGEHFNSIVAKVVGGKRVNFSKSRSYKARCLAAVVSHNTRLPLYTLHKTMYKKSPKKVLKLLQMKRAEKIRKAAMRRKNVDYKRNKPKKQSKIEKKESKRSYGSMAEKPDLTPDIYERKKTDFLKGLRKTEEEREELEKATTLQSECGIWKEERRKLLTASNFGIVCKRRKTTSCENLVKSLLYTDVDCPAMKYGRGNEINAITWIEEQYSVCVTKCGLFIDKEVPYLGATPDGLIGSDAIVEVKCPESCKKLTPQDAVLEKKFNFWNLTQDGEIIVNRKHNYFYQVQGQLHITNRLQCWFVLWTPLGAKLNIINRDDSFWYENMLGPLKRFYLDCLLPELVDPRYPRSMAIRDPQYILDARKGGEKRQLKQTVENVHM